MVSKRLTDLLMPRFKPSRTGKIVSNGGDLLRYLNRSLFAVSIKSHCSLRVFIRPLTLLAPSGPGSASRHAELRRIIAAFADVGVDNGV